jgi:hypothetical protein
MKAHISFTTGLFDSGERGSNDSRLGEDLARWFIGKSAGGEFAFAEPTADGRGWTENVKADGESFRLGFGILPGTVGADYADWRITIDKVNRWKMFGSSDSELRGRLCDLVHNILRDEGEIREVHWG